MQKRVREQRDQRYGIGYLKQGFGELQARRDQAESEEESIKRGLRSCEFKYEYQRVDADQGQIDDGEGISANCIA